MNGSSLLQSPAAVLAVLAGICAFFFYVEKKSGWKLFDYLPPLLWIYILPLVLSNLFLIPKSSPVYAQLSDILLPMLLVLLLIEVDVIASVRVLGKGILIGLFGTLGIVFGGPIVAFLFRDVLQPESWKTFGVLAGSLIGGTGNMAAVAEGLKANGTQFGLAVLTNDVIYIVWLPVLIWSKQIAKGFNQFTKVPANYAERIQTTLASFAEDTAKIEMRHIIYLLAISLSVTAIAAGLSPLIPEWSPVLTESTYRILLVTTMGISLSLTPAKKIPGARVLSLAFVYIFVACMGARADLTGLAGQAPWFILAGLLWLMIHALFTIIGARILKVDLHIAAISSAALIGGVASAPVVATHHHHRYATIAILMSLIAYSVGNYASFTTAYLCSLVIP